MRKPLAFALLLTFQFDPAIAIPPDIIDWTRSETGDNSDVELLMGSAAS